MTDTLIQNHLQVTSPTGSSTTRSLMNRRISPALKPIRFPKLRVMSNLLPHNQSLLSSTQDSIESVAMPQEADLDDEQIRSLLASPRYLPEREASAERSQVYHSEREGSMSSSSQGLNFKGTGELVALCSHQNRLNHDAFSERQQLVHVLGSDESIFRFSNTVNVARSLLDGNRDHLLTQARSELTKQEHKVESLHNCIVELQQQAYAQRLPITDTLNLDENKCDNKKN